ncbi:MAG: DUF853 family protein [Salinarimonadaceae bacterium]|nr:MAG: DUF853 family protein [Salinarimonadaceae bacterium]
MAGTIDIGQTGDGRRVSLQLRFANRHGLITGATGMGKTVTLQRIAEGFSRAGVPVFAADVKGDLSGIAAAGDPDGKAAARARELGEPFTPAAFPVRLWDVFRRDGLPVQTSVDRMGALIIARMLQLNQVQEGALSIAFKRTHDDGSAFLGLDDLRWELHDMLEMRAEVSQQYGNVTASSLTTVQREILALESQGANMLFAEPGLDIMDFLQVAPDGRGIVNLLHADGLMESPRAYACLLLWLLTELFRVLPEAGDLDKPKLVFFFDEAHLLFSDAPKKLLQTIERVVRLVRSKGVGVYFVTQSPQDVPDVVLAQLGNRIQHALRAYTAKDQKMVKAAAKAFRTNPDVDAVNAITSMGTGEGLVSCLVDDGVPAMVERVKILPPSAQIGPISEIEREAIILRDPLRHKYQSAEGEHAMGQAFIRRIRTERGLPVPDEDLPYDDSVVDEALAHLQAAPSRQPLSTRAWLLILAASAFIWGAFL